MKTSKDIMNKPLQQMSFLLKNKHLLFICLCLISQTCFIQEGFTSSKASKDQKFKNHWSFQAIKKPDLPTVKQKNWPKNAIDFFVLNQLEKEGLSPSKLVDDKTFIRRVKWDLLGLPVTFQESEIFEKQAERTKLIGQYLSSPHYGERWARYWLDIARYADTKGYVLFEDKNMRNAFTYRDYVIESFNNDKPYNQFILEQIAADQLDNITPKDKAALGFITVGPRFRERFEEIMSDRIDVVTRGLMGLTVSCARCHDHKYDPVSIDDFYSLYGVFRNSIEPPHSPFRMGKNIPEQHKAQADKIEKSSMAIHNFLDSAYQGIIQKGKQNLKKYLQTAQANLAGPDTSKFDIIVDSKDLNPALLNLWEQYLLDNKENSSVFIAWHELSKIDGKKFKEQAKEVIKNLNKNKTSINQIILNRLKSIDLTSFEQVIDIYVSEIHTADKEWQILQSKKENLLSTGKEALRKVISGTDSPLMVPMHYYSRLHLLPDRAAQGQLRKLIDEVTIHTKNAPIELAQRPHLVDTKKPIIQRVFLRGNPAKPAQNVTPRYLSFFKQLNNDSFKKGSGRLGLAKAIINENNPLTARVIVNRVWKWHFGKGLVHTVDDFGLQGAKPTHPQLLDYLSAWLMENNWSLKKLHRLIIESATYQQESHYRKSAHKQDPDNSFYWRTEKRRVDFESLIDSMKYVSNKLDKKIGGPSAPGIFKTNRRAIYSHIDRLNMDDTYTMFDFPDPNLCNGKRNHTVVPGQTLFLLNSEFVQSCAKQLELESRIIKNKTNRVKWLIQRILSRTPSDIEIKEMLEFIPNNESSYWAMLTQILLASNEFQFID